MKGLKHRFGALDARPIPLPRPKLPVPPRIEPVPAVALSAEDEDRLFEYQRRHRRRGFLEGLLPPAMRPRRGAAAPSPHRFSLHVFEAMGVVPARVASEAIVEVLVSARVLTLNRHAGNLEHLNRALAQLGLPPTQRIRVASIVHAFAAQSARRSKLELRMSQLSTLIGERQADCSSRNVPDDADRTLLTLQAERARLQALLDARPSELMPPPMYADDVSPPDYVR